MRRTNQVEPETEPPSQIKRTSSAPESLTNMESIYSDNSGASTNRTASTEISSIGGNMSIRDAARSIGLAIKDKAKEKVNQQTLMEATEQMKEQKKKTAEVLRRNTAILKTQGAKASALVKEHASTAAARTSERYEQAAGKMKVDGADMFEKAQEKIKISSQSTLQTLSRLQSTSQFGSPKGSPTTSKEVVAQETVPEITLSTSLTQPPQPAEAQAPPRKSSKPYSRLPSTSNKAQAGPQSSQSEPILHKSATSSGRSPSPKMFSTRARPPTPAPPGFFLPSEASDVDLDTCDSMIQYGHMAKIPAQPPVYGYVNSRKSANMVRAPPSMPKPATRPPPPPISSVPIPIVEDIDWTQITAANSIKNKELQKPDLSRPRPSSSGLRSQKVQFIETVTIRKFVPMQNSVPTPQVKIPLR